MTLDYLGEHNVIIGILISRKQRRQSQGRRRGEGMTEAEVRVIWFQAMQEASRNWKREEKGFSPRASRKNAILLTHFRLLTSRTIQ